jgi:L-asparaginase/Glu-tRNA(Gln) amidotransferase subunit D
MDEVVIPYRSSNAETVALLPELDELTEIELYEHVEQVLKKFSLNIHAMTWHELAKRVDACNPELASWLRAADQLWQRRILSTSNSDNG